MYHYLSFLWVPGPDTIIQDVKKLQPGSLIEYNLNTEEFNISQWWNFEIKEIEYNEKDLVEKVYYTLKDSVRRSTISDVGYACTLSGGLDSQTIVGLVKKLNINCETYTIGFSNFDEGPFNELKNARVASKYFETNHNEKIIDFSDYFKDLDKMIYYLDEPYGGGLPNWHVFKECKKKHKVLLTGLGGDEIFGNYGRWTVLEKFYFPY